MAQSTRKASATRSISFQPRKRNVIGGRLSIERILYRRSRMLDLEVSGQCIVIFFSGAGAAEGAAFHYDFTFEVDAFATLSADDARAFEAGQIFGLDFDFDPLFVEEDFVGELRVRFLLAGVFAEFGEHFAGGLLGAFPGGDADGPAGREIDESGGDFAPVAKFQSALAETAVGDERDGVGDAPVDFNVRNDALALGDRIVDAEFAQAEHREAHAEDLAGAKVAVGDRGELEIFSESLHGSKSSSSFLRGGPGMRLAGFYERQDSYDQRQRGEGPVADNGHAVEFLRRAEAAAVDVHVQKICAGHNRQEPYHDRRDGRGPDSQAPADQEQQAKSNFDKRQSMRHHLRRLLRDHFVRFDLLREGREIHRNRKFQNKHRPKMRVGHQELGESRVNENSAEDEPSDPDDGAASIQWAGLHHLVDFLAKLGYF